MLFAKFFSLDRKFIPFRFLLIYYADSSDIFTSKIVGAYMTAEDMKNVEKLYRINYFSLLMFTKSKIANSDSAEDILQDCFLEIIKNPTVFLTIDDNKKPAYLRTILKRKIAKFNFYENFVPLEDDAFVISQNTTDEIVFNNLILEKIFFSLQNTSQEKREIFNDYFIEGKTYDELATMYNLSKESSRQIICRLLKKIRKEEI